MSEQEAMLKQIRERNDTQSLRMITVDDYHQAHADRTFLLKMLSTKEPAGDWKINYSICRFCHTEVRQLLDGTWTHLDARYEQKLTGHTALPKPRELPLQGELNPNHKVTQEMREQWHKLLAVVMHKNKLASVEITIADLQAASGSAVIADARGGQLHVRFMDKEAAEKLVRAEGGLPV